MKRQKETTHSLKLTKLKLSNLKSISNTYNMENSITLELSYDNDEQIIIQCQDKIKELRIIDVQMVIKSIRSDLKKLQLEKKEVINMNSLIDFIHFLNKKHEALEDELLKQITHYFAGVDYYQSKSENLKKELQEVYNDQAILKSINSFSAIRKAVFSKESPQNSHLKVIR